MERISEQEALLGVTTQPIELVFPPVIGRAIATTSPVFQELNDIWVKVDTLWEGTDAMRMAGEKYLPKEELESDSDYVKRLNRSTLYNSYKRTIQSSCGRIFQSDIRLVGAEDEATQEVVEDTDTKAQPELQVLGYDIDAQGRNVTAFCKDLFEKALNHGAGVILVDYSRTPADFETLEQEREFGARPYWVYVPVTSILDCRTVEFKGKTQVQMFRYREVVLELSADGLTPISYQQIRVYKHDPGGTVMFAVYRQPVTTTTSTNWVLWDAGVLPTSGIPIAPVYTNRVGYCVGRPPLDDLADLNIQHWQVSSDFSNISHIVNVPFLFSKGLRGEKDADGVEKPFKISPHAGVVSGNADSDIKWVTHDGATMDSARQHLRDIEERMEQMGLELTLQIRPGVKTATEVTITKAESNSILKQMALGLQDSLNCALYYTSEFLGIPHLTRACVDTRYAAETVDIQSWKDVLESYKVGVITAETVIHEGKRRNILDPLLEIEPAEEPPVLINNGNQQGNMQENTQDTAETE